MAKFIKLQHNWWQYDETSDLSAATLINIKKEALYNFNLSDKNIIEANSFEELDWNDTEILSNGSKLGWLDRQGNFYGCEFSNHALQAKLIHNSSRQELEQKGWIHIFQDGFRIKAGYWANYNEGIVPTLEQLKYLNNHDYIDSKSVLNAYMNGNHTKARIYEQQERERN